MKVRVKKKQVQGAGSIDAGVRENFQTLIDLCELSLERVGSAQFQMSLLMISMDLLEEYLGGVVEGETEANILELLKDDRY